MFRQILGGAAPRKILLHNLQNAATQQRPGTSHARAQSHTHNVAVDIRVVSCRPHLPRFINKNNEKRAPHTQRAHPASPTWRFASVVAFQKNGFIGQGFNFAFEFLFLFLQRCFFCFCCREFSQRYMHKRAHCCVTLSGATTIMNIFCDVRDEAVYIKKKRKLLCFSETKGMNASPKKSKKRS